MLHIHIHIHIHIHVHVHVYAWLPLGLGWVHEDNFHVIGPGGFAGYYAVFLPERCWDSSGVKVLNEENWGSGRVVTCVDVISKKVTKMVTGDDQKGAWTVLDVSHDLIVAQFSTPNSPPQLVSL